MFHRIKKMFSPKKDILKTIEEMEQKKREMEKELELLIELENEIRKIKKQSNS